MKRVITHIVKPLLIWLAKGIVGLAFIAFMAFMIVEWMAGCGESYTDSKGKVHINECVFTTIKK
tara:strand:+ start:384 stop:575 length:192 start_codon:yes stop_codon:yes gene_type:complete